MERKKLKDVLIVELHNHKQKKDEIEQKLRNFRLHNPNVQFVRILLVGEVGAGKSSFINSVNNAFQRRITSRALVDGTGGTSFTKVYKTYHIEGEDGSPLPFVLNDIMGIEATQSGAHEKDIIKALHGFLEEGYKLNPASPVSPNDPGHRSNPALEDQTFCLVNIIAADKVSLMHNEVIVKLKKIRQAATDLNIPQVVIVTRPDFACPLVKDKLQKIYTSKKIKEKRSVLRKLLPYPQKKENESLPYIYEEHRSALVKWKERLQDWEGGREKRGTPSLVPRRDHLATPRSAARLVVP
ncbi:interferon-induced protein 44-like isoform X2 [Clarias gariepinus]|uniref:interferon-induced protein 44-like isoform X2 n=1 Tax=Clarias gariepinus TaxID=13013 RepID=UPI00234DF618|nr:interferon-induced protein 44-like isoform X2 [Clarias gariepinus]